MEKKKKRLTRNCQKCHYRQYYRKTTNDWRCDKCGYISNGNQIEEKKDREHSLVSADKVPERPKSKWLDMVEEFIDSGEKIAYVQCDNSTELNRVRSGLGNYASRHYNNVKVSQFGDLLRVYLERRD